MHELEKLVASQKNGNSIGICSVCSSNMFVIDAALLQAKETGSMVLIEATSLQVNPRGGYTGMTPEDYRELIYSKAAEIGLPSDRIILGGDHLGPVSWQKQPAAEAMAIAKETVYAFCAAGFTKIHLDTSMPLGDDGIIGTELIADRTVELCVEAEKGFAKWQESHPDAEHPVYIIGSEVPTPGGSGEEDTLSVTKPAALTDMIECFKSKFAAAGLEDSWAKVIGAVVQPGVEFGNDSVYQYVPEDATELMATARGLDGIVLEGHSTDYQPETSLRQLVEDGVAILKVGPALTFAAREGLFALAYMEKELNIEDPSNFIEVLDKAMMDNPSSWQGHYPAHEPEASFMRKFSLSDRSRYYMNVPEVKAAIDKLISNMNSVEIPFSLISQFAPLQCSRIRNGSLSNDARDIVIDKVRDTLGEYWRACGQ